VRVTPGGTSAASAAVTVLVMTSSDSCRAKQQQQQHFSKTSAFVAWCRGLAQQHTQMGTVHI
jgi:hypothetical protein